MAILLQIGHQYDHEKPELHSGQEAVIANLRLDAFTQVLTKQGYVCGMVGPVSTERLGLFGIEANGYAVYLVARDDRVVEGGIAKGFRLIPWDEVIKVFQLRYSSGLDVIERLLGC